MLIFLSVLSAVLFVLSAVLLFKIISVKSGLREIKRQLPEIAEGRTNALLTVSSADRDVKEIALKLNELLTELCAIVLKYTDGDREVKTALTNAAHDVRTPLTAILGYLDLLEQETDEAKKESYIRAMLERTNALKKLSEELFGYSVAADAYRKIGR